MSKDFYSNDSQMDEEFEFKPLTTGLGFQRQPLNDAPVTTRFDKTPHQKTNSTLQTQQSNISQSVSVNPSASLSETLPRQPQRNYRSESLSNYPSTDSSNQKIEEILSTLKNRPRLEIVERPENPYRHSSFELAAGVIDGLLIFALNLIALIGFIYSTRLDLFFNLRNPAEGFVLYGCIAALFASMAWSYLVATRVFAGQTAGEWVFEQRLGEPSDLGHWAFFGRVLLRSTIVVATGFITLPLLSMILRKDILGRMMGLELLRAK